MKLQRLQTRQDMFGAARDLGAASIGLALIFVLAVLSGRPVTVYAWIFLAATATTVLSVAAVLLGWTRPDTTGHANGPATLHRNDGN